MHYEPLRPNRMNDIKERYEFAHGESSVCVYDINTLDFVKEIPVGTNPDCHATSLDNSYLYIACFEGIYCINQDTLRVDKVIDTGKVYATNVMPDGNTLLVHDLCNQRCICSTGKTIFLLSCFMMKIRCYMQAMTL